METKAQQIIFKEKIAGKGSVKHAGILLGDLIICGCCGGILSKEDKNIEIIEILPWVNIEESIEGG